MPFLSAVRLILDASGKRVDPAAADGTYGPVDLQLGDGLSYEVTPNGAGSVVKVSAAAGPPAVAPWVEAVVDAGVLTIDWADGPSQYAAITGMTTIAVPLNSVSGAVYRLRLLLATGVEFITWDPSFHFGSAFASQGSSPNPLPGGDGTLYTFMALHDAGNPLLCLGRTVNPIS